MRNETIDILLVEDDECFRETMTSLLEGLGYSVISGDNGLCALHILDQGVIPKVIITDLEMPKMGGATFLGEVKKREHLAKIPVVLFSSHPYLERIAETLDVAWSCPKLLDSKLIKDKLEQIIKILPM